MQEYEIYLPARHNDGTLVDPEQIAQIEQELARTFEGYTHLKHCSQGLWKVDGVTFMDEVTIVRVLDDELPPPPGEEPFNMEEFKKRLERILRQESVLIVAREVRVL